MNRTNILIGGLALVALAVAFYALGVPSEVAGFSLAAVVQSSYSEGMRSALPGMIANMRAYHADTRLVEETDGIAFGVAVGRGSADNGCIPGAAAAADFVGVSMRDITLDSRDEDTYQWKDNIGVMTEGDIWVTVGGNVVDGGDVTFNSTTGVLSSAGTSGSQFAIAGARWMTTALSGELAILRLSGHLPSA